MKKKQTIISIDFEIMYKKHNVEDLPKSIQKAVIKLSEDYSGTINFKIGQGSDRKWLANCITTNNDLKTAREILKVFINKIEFIFNSKTKQIKRIESVIYSK